MYMLPILITFVIIIYILGISGTLRVGKIQKKTVLFLIFQWVVLFLLIKFGAYEISSIGNISLLFFDIDVQTGSFHDFITYIKTSYVGKTQILLLALIPAIIEEFSKWIALIFNNKYTKSIKSSSDIIWTIIYISLGFSLWETINYIISAYNTGIITGSHAYIYTIVRSVLLGAGHLFFSLIIGILYAQSRFEVLRRIDQKKHHKQKYRRSMERLLLPLIGVIIATWLHTLYNISIKYTESIYAIILIYLGMYLFTLWIQSIPFLFRKYNPLIKKIELLRFIKNKKEEIKKIDK